MANLFTITAATNSIHLDQSRQGETTFTVFNAAGRTVRGRAQVAAEDATALPWLTLDGESEREFPTAGTQQYTVRIDVPPDASAGSHTFRLDMVGVARPDEDYTEGPTVTFQVPEPKPEPGGFPWWIVAGIIGVLVVAALGYLIWDRTQQAAADAEATRVAQADATAAAEATATARASAAEATADAIATLTAMPTATPTSTGTPTGTPTPTPPPLGTQMDHFLGTWDNVNPNEGMPRLVIERVNNNVVSFHGYGNCSPNYCDWGVINLPFTPGTLIGTYDFGFKRTIIAVERSGRQLQAEVFHDYTEEDGRTDRTENHTLARQLRVLPTDLIVPGVLEVIETPGAAERFMVTPVPPELLFPTPGD